MDDETKSYPKDQQFSFEQIKQLLDDSLGKTLGEVDKKHVFDRTKTNPKITGIAGDVVEQSILGYHSNSDKNPDILVDGNQVEVKTTGIRFSKQKGQEDRYEAKEPMSITAVSPSLITSEIFDDSHFWKKLIRMLLVYYLYDSPVKVEAKDYANFELKGYEFHKFSDEDKAVLQNDWEIVRDFIKDIQKDYPENPESQYPRISSELRDRLLYIDTAPKWPNPPRFRLKRSVVTSIVQEHFYGNKHAEITDLVKSYKSYADIDERLREVTRRYKGKTVHELLDALSIPYDNINKLNKAISERIIIKMLGGESSKISKIDLFAKAGIIAKSICLTFSGKRTEDTKLFSIDFDEFDNPDLSFEDSSFYDFFTKQTIFIVFQERDKAQKFKDNIFVGFKRFSYDSDFIDKEVFKTWNEIKELIVNRKLVESSIEKKDGEIKINKNGEIAKAINFPKSNDHEIFVRGSGIDSSKKPLVLQGIRMYKQYIWVKGKYIVARLDELKYL